MEGTVQWRHKQRLDTTFTSLDSLDQSEALVEKWKRKVNREFEIHGVLRTKDIEQVYFKGAQIGTGSVGSVYIVQKHNYDKMNFVLKQVVLEQGFEEFL